MMSMQTLSSISVYDFFRTYNWTGETLTLESFNPVEITRSSQSLLTLKLENFLLNSNWTGEIKQGLLSDSIQHSNESLMSLSVKDFCQKIVWKSRPQIAPNTSQSSTSNLNDLSSSDLDLDNLSDLF